MATLGKKSGKGDVLYIRYKGLSPNGKRIQKYRSTGTTNLEIALAALDRFKARQLLGLDQDTAIEPPVVVPALPSTDPFSEHRNRRLEDLVTEWAESREGEVSPKQIHETKRKVLRIIQGASLITLADLNKRSVDRFTKQLTKQSSSSKGKPPKEVVPASVQTRNLYRKAIKTFDIWLTNEKYQPERVLLGLADIKLDIDGKKPVPSRDRAPLSYEELQQLLAAANRSGSVIEGYDGKTRCRLYILATATGYRRRELGSLVAASFQLEGDYPTVSVSPEYTKNGKPARQPVAQYLVPVIASWLVDLGPDQRLFPNLEELKTGKMMKHDLEEEAGIPYKVGTNGYRDFHSLRHHYITNCWTSGESAVVVQRMARHADQKTTQCYSHVPDRQRHEAANKMKRLPLPELE